MCSVPREVVDRIIRILFDYSHRCTPEHHPQMTLTAVNQVVQKGVPAKDRHNGHLALAKPDTVGSPTIHVLIPLNPPGECKECTGTGKRASAVCGGTGTTQTPTIKLTDTGSPSL